jgi:uracil permease
MNYILLGSQHFLSMISATILVPLLTGMPVSVALFTSGVGTIIFHKLTKDKVPAYLGSSFAFIAPLAYIVANQGIRSAAGGVIFAGLIYLIFSRFIKKINLKRYLPPVVVAPIIMLIGLSLAPVAIEQAQTNILISVFTLVVAIAIAIFAKGFFKLVPVMGGIIAGYFLAIMLGAVDFSPIASAEIIGFPKFFLPNFNLTAISVIAPVALVTMVEHIGDILAIENTIKEDIVGEVGLNKTLQGDGVATMFAGLLGGVPNTTYGENTAVLALTKVYDARVVKIGAIIAIILSFLPKASAFIFTVPEAVLGGISILLFGMITAIGLRTLVESNTDLNEQRNLIIISVILVIGLGGAVFNVGFEVSELAAATIIGILLNIVLPE